jgi:hypothetical protein
MIQRNDDPGRPPSHIPYTQANLEKRMAQAGAELGAYLASDPGVQAAGTALEQAMAKLQMAEDRKANVPYPGFTQRAPQRLRDWQGAVSDVEAAKAEVVIAEKAWRVAQNDAAAARHSAQRQNQEKERASRLEAEQARHAMLEEAEEREKAWAAYVAVGGTREMFDSWFPVHYKRVIAARAQERMGAQTRELRASGKYQL